MKLHQHMSEFISMESIANILRNKDYSVRIELPLMRVIDDRGASLIFSVDELGSQKDPVAYIDERLKAVEVRKITKDGIEEPQPHKFKSVATSLECIGYKAFLDDDKDEMYVEVVSDNGRAVGRLFSYEMLESIPGGDAANFIELAMNRAEVDESNMLPRFLQDVGDALVEKGYDVAVTRDGNRIQVSKHLMDGATIIRQFTKTEVLDYINPPANLIDAVMGRAIEDHIEYGGND